MEWLWGLVIFLAGYAVGYLRYEYAARALLHDAFPDLATPAARDKHKKAVFQYYMSRLPGWLFARLETREEAEIDCASCYASNLNQIPLCEGCPHYKRRRTTFENTVAGLEVCCPGVGQ